MFHYQFNYLNRSILNVLKNVPMLHRLCTKRTCVQKRTKNVLKPVLYRICTNFFRFHAPFFLKITSMTP